ncbi:MAG: c-type cytochrome [Methylococcaceae bacterium]
MTELTLFRTLAIYSLCLFVTGLSGCSVFGKQSAVVTPAEAEKTAYYQCGGCHGPANVRVNFMTPNIMGQKKGYLAQTLRDYRDKKRIEPLMNGVIANMSDQEIDSLAAYFSNTRFDDK